jgi:hypothetical protein
MVQGETTIRLTIAQARTRLWIILAKLALGEVIVPCKRHAPIAQAPPLPTVRCKP